MPDIEQATTTTFVDEKGVQPLPEHIADKAWGGGVGGGGGGD